MTVEEIPMTEMDDESIRAFLSNQKMGVLGLPTDGEPYLLPMSFGFDNDATLYFAFVGGPESRKRGLMERTDRARFLTYTAQSAFNWESVLMTGTVGPVPEADLEEIRPVLEGAWRPDVIAAAMESQAVTPYQLEIDEWTGYKHTGLPPGFDVGE